MTFYGKAVDEAGRPLAGVEFWFRVEAFPKDWTFQTRGRPHDIRSVATVSDANGCFQFDLVGCAIEKTKAFRAGYRELEELDSSGSMSNGFASVYSRRISLISRTDQFYKSDPASPAIYVFVHDGVYQTSALPSLGGLSVSYQNGKRWIKNPPKWPQEPSLPDVDWTKEKARVNVAVPIIVKVVDTEGKPLPGIKIWIDYLRYRSAEEMRQSRPYYKTKRTEPRSTSTLTDQNGMADAMIHGFQLVRVRAHRAEAKWKPFPVLLDSWDGHEYKADLTDDSGNAIHRWDEANPMTLVMLDEGQTVSSVMPSLGGCERHGDAWRPVPPQWPKTVRPTVRFAPTTMQSVALP